MIDAIDRIRKISQHLHSAQGVAPLGADPIQLISGGTAWTEGEPSELLAAGFVTHPFDVHWIIISDPSANASYEIVLYCGDPDVECARAKFTKSDKTVESVNLPIQMKILPAESRVRATLMDSVGGSSLLVSIAYHEYE